MTRNSADVNINSAILHVGVSYIIIQYLYVNNSVQHKMSHTISFSGMYRKPFIYCRNRPIRTCNFGMRYWVFDSNYDKVLCLENESLDLIFSPSIREEQVTTIQSVFYASYGLIQQLEYHSPNTKINTF